MYFLLLFQVISRSCFRLTPAASTIVHSVLHGCPDWPVISIYTLRCLLSTIHARGSIQFIHLSGLCSPIRVMPNDQKESEGSSVPAEVGQSLQVIVEATQQPLIKSFPCLRIFLRKN